MARSNFRFLQSAELQRSFRRARPGELRQVRITEQGAYSLGHGLREFDYSPDGLSTLSVYRVLRANFGRPRRFPDYDRKTQWEFLLKGPNSFLSVYDWKLWTWGIGVRYGGSTDLEKQSALSAIDAELLLSLLKRMVRRLPIETKGHTERLVENMFHLNYLNGENFLYEVEKKSSKELLYEGREVVEEEASWGATACFLLSIEAFLNVVYICYLRPEIRKDKDLNDRLMSLSPLDKWSMASFLCTCLKKPLVKSGQAYGKLRELVRMRNELAHSILDEKHTRYVIEEDGFEFITRSSSVPTDKTVGIGSLGLPRIKQVKEDVDLVVEQFKLCMYAKDRREFEDILENQYIVFSGH